jgi:hypothetical protein
MIEDISKLSREKNVLELGKPFDAGDSLEQKNMIDAAEKEGIIDDEKKIYTVAKLKQEIVEHKDFFEQWEGLIHEVFPELDDISAAECLDELKKLRLTYGFIRDIKKIKRLLKKTEREFFDQKNSLEEGEKEKSFSAIFSDILLYEIL